MAVDANIVANSGLGAGYAADDHSYAYFSARSGLTPPRNYTITDHKIAYYRTKLPSSLTHIDDLSKAWKDSGQAYTA